MRILLLGTIRFKLAPSAPDRNTSLHQFVADILTHLCLRAFAWWMFMLRYCDSKQLLRPLIIPRYLIIKFSFIISSYSSLSFKTISGFFLLHFSFHSISSKYLRSVDYVSSRISFSYTQITIYSTSIWMSFFRQTFQTINLEHELIRYIEYRGSERTLNQWNKLFCGKLSWW